MTKKFADNPNVAVFTTKYILERRSPILYVYHYEDDGAWSFSGNDLCEGKDYRIMSLEEMISLDNSILELADMPLGFCAKRKDVSSVWVIERFDEELS